MTFYNLKRGLSRIGEPRRLELGDLKFLPITMEIEFNRSAILRICEERNFNSVNFFSQTPVTELSTLEYLRNGAISDDSRILFLIQDLHGAFVGQVGFKNLNSESVELDAVIKYRPSNFSMYQAIKFLLGELQADFNFNFISLEVRSDNNKAIALYERLGFILIPEETQDPKCIMRLIYS